MNKATLFFFIFLFYFYFGEKVFMIKKTGEDGQTAATNDRELGIRTPSLVCGWGSGGSK